jgi:hypothetical protein
MLQLMFGGVRYDRSWNYHQKARGILCFTVLLFVDVVDR